MNRREFLKRTELLGAGAVISGENAAAQPRKREKSGAGTIRNILFLLVDQQRQDCLGCYGNPIVQTPNIDRLARTGVRFTNAFTPTPLCSPARTSLQTGLWAHNTRVMFNTGQGGLAGGLDDPKQPVPYFSDVLKERSWQLAHVGKWHIGSDSNTPSVHGYEGIFYPGYGIPSGVYGAKHAHYIEYLKRQGLSGFNLLTETRDPDGRKLYSGLQEGTQEASIPTYLAGQTIEYLERYAENDRPFFVSCNFWGPHEPYCIPKKHYEMYKNEHIDVWQNFDCDLSDKPDAIRRYGDYWRTGWFTERALAGLIAEYYGYITLIDEEIGRILATLEKTGKLDETLIVYSADHGSTVGSYRMWAKGFGMYDVMTRIPMIVSHPSIQPSVSEGFVTLLDLAPTFLETAGYGSSMTTDGASLGPILRGERDAVREDHIVTEAFGHVVPFWQRMVRTPHSKYIYSPTDIDEFYDLDADPYETRNLIRTIGKNELRRHRELLIADMERNNDPLVNWAKSTIMG